MSLRGTDLDGCTNKTDIWSLGIVLFELIEGSTPYPEKTESAYLQAMTILGCPRLSRECDFSDELVNLIRKCTRMNPEERLSAEDVLSVLSNSFTLVGCLFVHSFTNWTC